MGSVSQTGGHFFLGGENNVVGEFSRVVFRVNCIALQNFMFYKFTRVFAALTFSSQS